MSKISLGGLKVFESRAHLCLLCPAEKDGLGELCSTMAAGRLNMGFVAHIRDVGSGVSLTAACARKPESFSGYALSRSGRNDCTLEGIWSLVCRVSIFPHDQRPDVAASLLSSLWAGGVRPYAIGSSPSALTLVVSLTDFNNAMEHLFDCFQFTSCASHQEWQASCRVDEKLLSEVRCSYSEHTIAIYGITSLGGLDLLTVFIPPESLGELGSVLFGMNEAGLRLPFLVSIPAPERGRTYFSFVVTPDHTDLMEKTVGRLLPGSGCSRRGPVSLLFLHGPHFGDRYGIAKALVEALREANITILALSCAVSSISVVVGDTDREKTILALNTHFQTPSR